MDAACSHACPHLGGSDRRCAGRWTLDHLDEAFTYCLGAFRHCQVYNAIAVERAGERRFIDPSDPDPSIVRRLAFAGEGGRPARELQAAATSTSDPDTTHERIQRPIGRRTSLAPPLEPAILAPQPARTPATQRGRGVLRRGLLRLGLVGP